MKTKMEAVLELLRREIADCERTVSWLRSQGCSPAAAGSVMLRCEHTQHIQRLVERIDAEGPEVVFGAQESV